MIHGESLTLIHENLSSHHMDFKNKEEIANYVPIFRHPESRLLAVENVYKVGKRKNINSRILYVGTPGIYLFKKQSFSRSIKTSNSLSLFDLVSIQVTGQVASFSTRQSQIRIQCENINQIAFLVYFVRQALFPTSLLPITIHFPSEVQFTVSSRSMPYKAENVFVDRIFACMSHFEIDTQPSQSLFKDMVFNSSFAICPEVVSSPIFPAVILSLAFEDSLKTVIFSNVNLAQVIQQCSALFCINRYIKKIVFNSVDLHDAANEFEKVLSVKHLFQASEFTFQECTIDSHAIIESLKIVGSNITKLIFKKCKFTERSLTNIFQTIFFNKCFHDISTFIIDYSTEYYDLDILVVNLGCCSWVMDSKCIHHLSFSFDDIPAAKILTQLFNFDIGLNCLELKQSILTQPISVLSSPTNMLIQYVDFSYSTFSAESLISLFTIIHKEITNISFLKLSSIIIDQNELSVFLEAIQHMNLNSLQALDFDHIRLDSSQTALFSIFLLRQKKLIHLSLDSSISISESSEGFKLFSQVIGKLDLKYLFVNNDKGLKEFDYGELLIPLLKDLASRGTIRYLGLINQTLKEEGVNLIRQLLDKDLKQLLIDSFHAQDINQLISLCQKIIKKLVYSAFPTNELQRLIDEQSIDLATDQNLQTEINHIQQQLLLKFKAQPDIEKELLSKLLPTKFNVVPSASNVSLNDYVPSCFNNVDELTKRSNELNGLLKQCININSPTFSEPILSLIEEYDEKLSFQAIKEFIET